jgi:hypothetical protein
MDDEGDPLVHTQGLEQSVEVEAVLDEAIREIFQRARGCTSTSKQWWFTSPEITCRGSASQARASGAFAGET